MFRSTSRSATRTFVAGLALVAAVGVTACNQAQRDSTGTSTDTTGETTATSGRSTTPGATATPGETSEPPAVQPLPAGHIEVQHVLVGFQGSVPGKSITRSQEQARTLAYQILERAKGGESFDALVQQHTDDAYPGVYRLADNGVTPEQGVEYPRSGMVKGFGDAAFPLAVGGVGIADFDTQASPYGWHIIKRLR